MGKRKLGALEKADADLPDLQHKIRCDPLSYRGDFENQYRQYEAYRELVMQAPASAPSDDVVSLRNLVDFVSHVANCYPDLTNTFPQDLIKLISSHHEVLEPELREKLVTSLVLLRRKELLDSPILLNALFPILISTSSKSLRTLLYQKLLSDLRTSNSRAKNHKLNRSLQATLFQLLTSDRTSSKGIWAVRIVRELWRRQIWTDAKSVEIMKEAALSLNTKVILGGVNFFLGGDKEHEEHNAEASSDDERGGTAIDIGKLRHQADINKKSRKRNKELKQAAATVKKRSKKKSQPHPLSFSALHLLHDPQGFAETLFARHLHGTSSGNPGAVTPKLNLEQKLQTLQLVSRLVGLHKLTILPLYSWFLRFLAPRQTNVTSFLASLAQSTHNLVPPDALEPLLQKIANEFVSEASAGPVAAAGLNAIREVCTRQPLAMNETLLQDLVMYRKSKDKGVMMAAKGLMSLYRDVGPEMLKRRDRGRDAVMGMRKEGWNRGRFGEEGNGGGFEGIELLEAWREEEKRRKRAEKGLPEEVGSSEEDEDEDEADEAGWSNWDVSEDGSDDSGGWIEVQSDGEDINVSDSEDEKDNTPPKRQKTDDSTSYKENQPNLENTSTVQSNEPNSQDAPTTQTRSTISDLATKRILTPADLAKLSELRYSHAVTSLLPSHRKHHSTTKTNPSSKPPTTATTDAPPLTPSQLAEISNLGHRATKEEKAEAHQRGRDETEKFRGKKARRQEKKREQGKSSTNKEKARGKNFLMTMGKGRMKRKRSLREVGRGLRGAREREKRGGRRGNR